MIFRGKANLARGKRPRGEMNKLEEAYARELELLVTLGEIYQWEYESHKLNLLGGWYTPDFKVILPDGTIEFHETKGFRETATILRANLAARRYPYYTFKMVEQIPKREGGGWKVTVL